jgi:hypothetical protein
VGEEFDRLANAARLVNAALLADGQVHGKMQERVGAPILNLGHGGQRSVHVLKVLRVLRVLIHPLIRYDFDSFQPLTGEGFSINRAKETTDIG